MKVVLLVAGQGSRLRPYTNELPKCKVELKGEALLSKQLRVLKEVGIKDDQLLFITGFHNNKIDNIDGASYIHNKVFNKCNLVYSLFQAIELLEDEEEIIVSYGDIIYDKSVMLKLKESPKDISVVIDREWENYWASRMENPLDDAKTLKIAQSGTISEIGKKPMSSEDCVGQYIGLTKFSGNGKSVLFNYLKKLFGVSTPTNDLSKVKNKDYYMQELLSDLISNNFEVWPVSIYGEFLEIDEAIEFEELDRIYNPALNVKENRLKLIEYKQREYAFGK